jgi:hypothetical protein
MMQKRQCWHRIWFYVVLAIQDRQDKYHETLSRKLSSLSLWRRESNEAKLNMFKRRKAGSDICYKAEDFFVAIENRENHISNRPHLEEEHSEKKGDDAIMRFPINY